MYRTIYSQLWTDKKVAQLTVQGKLLFLYLITNPHTHLSGLYYLPHRLICEETGLTDTLCHTLFDTLSELGLAHEDRDNKTVFVVNMFSYQGQGEKNEKCAAHHLETLHDSPLIHLFLERYPKVMPYCSDTLSDTLSHRGTDPSKRFPSVPDPVLLTSSPVRSSDLKSINHSKKAGNGARPFPDDLVFDDSIKSNWASHGIDPAIEFAKFRDHHRARATKFSDWKAAWRNWARNAIKFKEERDVRPMR